MFPIKFFEKPEFVCKDHTVTGEEFALVKACELDLYKTIPQPEPEKILDYYKSDKYISHTDSSLTIIDKLYQTVKGVMLRKKMLWINKWYKSPGHILDVGAGTGDFLLTAKKYGWKVTGIEPSASARSLAGSKDLFLLENSSALPDAQFEVITLWHVLEHMTDLETEIKELKRLLKPSGHLIIAVPNHKSLDAKMYGSLWAAYDVPRHVYHFSPSAIKTIFQSFKFGLRGQRGLLFDAFYVSLLSEKNSANSTNIFKALWIGLRSNIEAVYTGNYSSIAYFFQKD